MKKAVARSILVVVMLLAFAVIAEAQQAKKVPRLGVPKIRYPYPYSPVDWGGICAGPAGPGLG
jgi:hypothetical protein